MWDCELDSQSKSVYIVSLRCQSFRGVLPHFVTFLGFEDFEDLFGFSFGRISHDCAWIWVSLVDLFGVVDVEEGLIGTRTR